MAESRKLPIEQRDDARLGRMKHEIAYAVVAVHQGGGLVRGYMLRQPSDQTLDVGVLASAGELPLATPAVDLAGEIIARLPEIAEADRSEIHIMEDGERACHRLVHSPAIAAGHAGQGTVVEHAAIHALHHIEWCTDDAAVGAIEQRRWYWHVGVRQCADDPIFPVDRVRRGQELSRRLLAQHQAAVIVRDEESGVRLSAGDPFDVQCTFQTGDGGPEERIQSIWVEASRIRVDKVAHDVATGQVQNAVSSLSRKRLSTIWWTSSAPSTRRA